VEPSRGLRPPEPEHPALEPPAGEAEPSRSQPAREPLISP
jgi:hypothetical protein